MIIDDLIIAMTGDASVNALVTGDITYEHLPVNFNTAKNYVVFTLTSTLDTHTLDRKNAISEYEVTVQSISQDLPTVLSISNLLKTHLNGYDDKARLRDITHVNDNDVDSDLEKGVYFQTSIYNVLYVN